MAATTRAMEREAAKQAEQQHKEQIERAKEHVAEESAPEEPKQPTPEQVEREKKITALSKELDGICRKLAERDKLVARRNEILVEMHSAGVKTGELALNTRGTLSKPRIIQILSKANKQS